MCHSSVYRTRYDLSLLCKSPIIHQTSTSELFSFIQNNILKHNETNIVCLSAQFTYVMDTIINSAVTISDIQRLFTISMIYFLAVPFTHTATLPLSPHQRAVQHISISLS